VSPQAQIEQAVFTSACTREQDGYHLVATSPGVSAQDARELVVWGPTHDSLAEHCSVSGSINYHALPSGLHCVSRTSAAGSEYSDRGGHRIYTHCLLVPTNVMWRFANNPFRVAEAASASGRLDVMEKVPGQLEPFRLIGRATPLDHELLRWMAYDLGPRTCAALVEAAVSGRFVRIIEGPPPERLLPGLISLLPPPCRRDLSMSTGLRHSTRRPYRLMFLETDPGLRSRVAQREDTVLLNLSGKSSNSVSRFRPWIQRVMETLRSEQWDQLAGWYAELDDEVRTEDLDEIATRWCPSPKANASSRTLRQREPASTELFQEPRPQDGTSPCPELSDTSLPGSTSVVACRGRRSPQRAAQDPSNTIVGSAGVLDLDHAALMENLEELDGAVLDAIDGVAGALGRVRTMWPEVLSRLPAPLVDESRQQYVHFAVRGWRDADSDQERRDPLRAIAALDVLATLFEEK
jgi:hypothetical protein